MILMMLLLLGLVAYTLWHLWTLVPLPHWGKWAVTGLCLACFLLEFVTVSPLIDRLPLNVASLVYNIGNKTVIILLYLLMAFLLLDLGRLVHLVPRNALNSNLPMTVGLAVVMAGIFIYGSIHYHNKQRIELSADSGGRMERPLRIVMASDLHIGYHNRRAEVERWVDIINGEQPDLVLFAGDIIDFSMRPVLEEDMAAALRRLEAPVLACLGNHEYYADKEQAEAFYRAAHITLLKDSSIDLGKLTVIGRDDRTNPYRKALTAFATDKSQYTILLDHQPYHLEEAEQAGIDFQLSGHTHDGQVWPLSWLLHAMYECSYGAYRRGATGYYVTSGLGIWGAKYRIGTQSEYVVLNVR